MSLYSFFYFHTDVERMSRALPKYVIDWNLDMGFDPICLNITIPDENFDEFINFSKDFIIDSNDVNTPTKRIEASLPSGVNSASEIEFPIDQYEEEIYKQALSISIDGERIFLDIPIEGI